MPTKIQEIPLFFIIGRPRSGTTMLRMLFESHPNVIIPPECPFIISLYKKYAKKTFWDEALVNAFVQDLSKQTYFDKWLMDTNELKEKLMEFSGQSSFKTMIRALYLAYPSLFPKDDIHIIGDKNPAYSLYLKRIYKLFPEARFIYINRDYRDNYLSLVRVNFEVPVVPLVVYRWKFAYRLFRRLQKKNPGNFYYIRYEDIISAPEKSMRTLCDFCGIEYRDDVFDFHKDKQLFEKAYGGTKELEVIHSSLLNPVSKGKAEVWKDKMPDADIRKADMVAGKTAEEAGYERKYRKGFFMLGLRYLPLLAYARLIYALMLAGERLPLPLRNFLLEILGIFLKVYWKLNPSKINQRLQQK